MKSVALSLVAAAAFIYACASDDTMYPVIPQSNAPVNAQTGTPPSPAPPDARISDAGTPGDGHAGSDGGPGFDALPTAFDAGAPTDVGSHPADAGVPPMP
jgi:hypothetical protein